MSFFTKRDPIPLKHGNVCCGPTCTLFYDEYKQKWLGPNELSITALSRATSSAIDFTAKLIGKVF